MKTQILIEGNLKVHIYYPDSAVADGVLNVQEIVLFLPGLPQSLDKNFSKKVIEDGKALVWLHYYGSWFSGGFFSPDNCRKSFVDCLSLLHKKIATNAYDGGQFNFNFKEISLIGNSFGAQIALTSPVDYSLISSISLFSPFLFVHEDDCVNFNKLSQTIVDVDLPFWRRGMNNVYRGIDSPEWDNYFNGKDAESRLKKEYPKIFLVTGTEDDFVTPEYIDNFSANYLVDVKKVDGVGHNFLELYDKR